MSQPTITRIPSLNIRRTTVSSKAVLDSGDENNVQRRTSMKANKLRTVEPVRKSLSNINNTVNTVADKAPAKPYNNDTKSHSELKKSEKLLHDRVVELEQKLSELTVHNTQLQSDVADSNARCNKLVELNAANMQHLNDEIAQIKMNHENTIKQMVCKHDSELDAQQQVIDQLTQQLHSMKQRLHSNNIDLVRLKPLHLTEQQQVEAHKFNATVEQTLVLLAEKLSAMQQHSDIQLDKIASWKSVDATH